MWIRGLLLFFLCLLLLGPLWILLRGEVDLNASWGSATRASAGIAPDPATTPEAIVQVYAARAFGWRGLWGVHPWIAVKPRHAARYTVYQVSGWGLWSGGSAVSARPDIPDRHWFSQTPRLLAELRGERAAQAIEKIARASQDYPYAHRYSVWPGPNSNTYVAFIARRVPELGIVLPATAIGKDYLGPATFIARAASGTGYQFSLRGLLGVTLARKEGLEINLLGLALGINPFTPALNVAGIGLLKP